jgi:hypothetical protein
VAAVAVTSPPLIDPVSALLVISDVVIFPEAVFWISARLSEFIQHLLSLYIDDEVR